MRPLSTPVCWASLALQLQLAHGFPTQSVLTPRVSGKRGAVASESSICSKIGADIVGIGGTAADAMVATTLCVGVIGMYHSGIGGGGFMLVRDEKGRYEVIDYREMAPAASDRDMYKDKGNASTVGGLSVGIPGELRGLEYLHKTFGKLPWATLVKPAVRVARDGFLVNKDLVRYMDAVGGNTSFLVTDPVWAMDFAPNGKLVEFGDLITRKRYATTLDEIAERGPSAFYEGKLAESMIDTIQETGGIMTLDDLKQYTAKVKNALSIDYRGYKLFTTDAPSSGAVMLSILNTMNQYPPGDSKDLNLTSHRYVEAMKFAYGARAELGDPDFIRNIRDYEKQMLSVEKAQQIRARILDNMTQPLKSYNPALLYTVESPGTSHIVTADRSGMTVSSTTTINLLFGSKAMTPDTGIILNNEMDDFSQPGKRNSFGFEPSPSNFIAPGKRPLSSISPVIVEFASNRSVYFTTGAAGGSRIISATAQTVFGVLEQGYTMHGAVAHPRLHDQLMPTTTLVELGTDGVVYESLKAKNHNVTWQAPGQSAVQAVMRLWDGSFDAIGETRQVNSGGSIV
ncbi:gamma-glutamyltranspeptidase [Immersiella caudata]|uniref:Glutathione hydrolase n=1 Tax=Immersiella caudata TaxID=314043 RepID=A0AA39X3E6_9PEZI|nr:gamma-glutamyltranspeptidase [Immersiella caudata]